MIPGEDAFHLWDTYGFPVDLTRDVAIERGFTIDEDGFSAALAEQKEKSRASVQEKVGLDVTVYAELLGNLQEKGIVGAEGVKHLIYEAVSEVDTTVAGLIVDGDIGGRGPRGFRSRSCLAGNTILCRKWWSGERHR